MAKPRLAAPEPTSAYINRTSREYSRYVLDHRGIPCYTDALKSGQRIALHLLRTVPGKIKTAAFAGSMIESELYVHASTAAADAISKLAAPYTNNHPLITGDGAFGTRSSPNTFSNPRYTNVLRSKFAGEVLYTDHEIVPQMDNYDGSHQMPATFLPLIPLLLLNGIRGIAVGWSTFILPRSLADIKAATLEYIRTGKIGARLYPKYENYNVKVTKGERPGQYVVSGKFERIGPRKIRISEIPLESQTEIPTLTKYREHLIWLEDEGVITDFTDKSKSEIDIEIEFSTESKDAWKETVKIDGKNKTIRHPEIRPLGKWTDDEIMKILDLRHVLTERLVALGPPDDPGVRQFASPQDVVRAFVDWRLGWYKARYERLAQMDADEELFQRCLIATYDAKVPDVFTLFANKTALKEAVAKAITKAKLELREDIVERLAQLPGYRWTKEGRAEAETAARAAEKRRVEHTTIAKSPARQKKIYESEVEAIGV